MTDDDYAEMLTLDAVVAADYWNTALDRVRAAAAGHDVRRVVDLGSGTGNGARGLAARFTAAEIVAIDSDADLLASLAASEPRIRPVLADLDVGWPAEVADVDVTFASMSLHHMGDAATTLRQLATATRPGGIVAAAEFREPLRVLRDDVGGGLEARCMAVLRHGHPMPDLEADWAALLTAAGFEVVDAVEYRIDHSAPLDRTGSRYAELWLARMRHAGHERFPAADRDALDRLIAGAEPDALHLHGERQLVIGRRP